ncbi:Cytochrome c oxidase subunit [Tyrophagus putrescentiae]|nr:Cytochrome c oxidase subunit [Tyrophagus putrescentiae]
MAGTLAKPQLRNLLISSLQKHIPFAVVLSIAGAFAAKVFYRDARREKIAEFYRTYDVEAENARLRDMGLWERKDK